MTTGQQIVDEARRWMGQRYWFGAEQEDCTARDTDCSELVEAVCRCLAVIPTMPDGSGNQFNHADSYGLVIPFEQAAGTVGALIFKSYTDAYPPGDRNAGGIYHVALVAGPDRTVEACCDDGDQLVERSITGRSWYGRGALIPGVTYDPPTTDTIGEDTMGVIVIKPGEPSAGATYFLAGGKRFDVTNSADRTALREAFGEAAVSREMYDRLTKGLPKG